MKSWHFHSAYTSSNGKTDLDAGASQLWCKAEAGYLPDRATAVLCECSPGLVSAASSILVRNMIASQSQPYPPWQWWMDGRTDGLVSVCLPRGCRLALAVRECGWRKPVQNKVSVTAPHPHPNLPHTHTHTQRRDMIIFPKSGALPLPLKSSIWPTSYHCPNKQAEPFKSLQSASDWLLTGRHSPHF